MLPLAIVAAAAPAGPEPHQHVLAAPGARAPDRVALLAGATPDLWSGLRAAAATPWPSVNQTTPSAGGSVASRVMRDVTDGVNELLNDLPADKLRNDVQKIARLLGAPPR